VAQAVALRVRAMGARIEAFFGRAGEAQLVQAAQARGDAPGGVLVRHAFGAGEASTHVDLAGDRFVVMIDLGADAPAKKTKVAVVLLSVEPRIVRRQNFFLLQFSLKANWLYWITTG
jgi:hypothetical protein